MKQTFEEKIANGIKGKDIGGYEGLYMVFEDGSIWSYPKEGKHNGRFLEGSGTKNSYKLVCLTNREGVRKMEVVHRLVALTFLTKDDISTEVNHKNGIKRDNRLENLEWVTRGQNIRHSIDILGNKKPLGIRSRKRAVRSIDKNGVIEYFDTILDAASANNLNRANLCVVLGRDGVSRKGKRWEYVN
jgi:hypothetical protein